MYLSLFIIHIWSFHSTVFFSSLASISLFCSLHSFWYLISGFGFNNFRAHRLHLFPIVPMSCECYLWAHTRDRGRERKKRRNYLKWNFLPFQERILFIEMAECITWFYDIWSIQNHNIISSVCPSLSIHLYSIPLFSMELTITNRVNQFEDQCHSVEKVTKIPTLSLSLVFFCCLFGCNNVFPVENCEYRYREFVCLTFD